MIKVLVVDDSALMRKLLGRVFSAEADFDVAFARDGAEALESLAVFGPDVVTLDVHMPRMGGLECLDRIMIERPCSVIMVASLTAEGADATFEALRLGAVDFVAKPDGPVSLQIDTFGPELVSRVRAAAAVKPRSSLRLSERIRRKAAAGPTRRLTTPRPRSSPIADPATGDGLVLVGVSTGGPPALEALLTPLPADFAWPILVAQHMPATFTGPLARRLNGLCALTVTEVAGPTLLKPGWVYIGHGDADIIVVRGLIGLVATSTPPTPGYPWRPSVDRLVRSALDILPARQLIGVLMTGMGNDGAAAMAQMHNQGGRTIAEAEETAVVWGMPGELVKAEGADWVEPLPKIASRLRTLTPTCL